MPYAVLLRRDSAGAEVLIRHDDSEPPAGGHEASCRVIAETDDPVDAVLVADLLRRRIKAGEL
jgi:hypothetical protein